MRDSGGGVSWIGSVASFRSLDSILDSGYNVGVVFAW